MINRKLFFLSIVLIFFLFACKGFVQTFQKLQDVENAVKKFSRSENVEATIHSSTSEGTDITVLLYNYNIGNSNINELKRKAIAIDSVITATVPEWKNVKYRSIDFSPSKNPDNADNIVTFKFEGNKITN